MSDFDVNAARKFLREREEKEKARFEEMRKNVLEKTVAVLKQEFQGSSVEVYLVGSIIQPLQFSDRSDIDIVLKNYQGNLFDIWSKLQQKLDQTIEVILFETCHFQEYILKYGQKVI